MRYSLNSRHNVGVLRTSERLLLLPCVIAVALAACDSTVRVEMPADGFARDPVSEFHVEFHPDFQPGSFKAYVDGIDITQSFSPTPVPGGKSTGQAPAYYDDTPTHTNKLSVTALGGPGWAFDEQREFARFDPPDLAIADPDQLNFSAASGGFPHICLAPTPSHDVVVHIWSYQPIVTATSNTPVLIKEFGSDRGEVTLKEGVGGIKAYKSCYMLHLESNHGFLGPYELQASCQGCTRIIARGRVKP